MEKTFDHGVVASFIEYLNYKVLTKSHAFSNAVVNFYPVSSPRLSNRAVYSAPYKPFCHDLGITGGWIPSGISGTSSSFIARNTSGLQINWKEGQISFSGVGSGLTNLSGGFSVADFNVIYSPKDEESLLFDTKFVLNNPKIPQTLTGLAENEITYPAIIVKYYPGSNRPFAFGGTEETKSEFRCIVISDDQFKLDGASNIIRDLARSYFGLLAPHETPFNFLGDIKSGNSYNYTGLANPKVGADVIMIDNVFVSPLNAQIATEVNPGAKINIIDLEIKPVRNTRG